MSPQIQKHAVLPMTRDTHCNRLTDCAQCLKASEGIFIYRKFLKGQHLPADKCTQNCILFMLSGELLINSQEYPGTTLHNDQFILQAIGSKIELLALTDVEYLVYWFNDLPHICEDRYRAIMQNAEAPLTYAPLTMALLLAHLMVGLTTYLDDKQLPCGPFLQLKAQEIIYLLTCYYPTPQLSDFFFPISKYTESFHYFVMQNYHKVKNVEEFAHLGGYTTTTFRRLFRNLYGVPVYEWILDKKREGILDDLRHTQMRITEISNQYGFDSLSHFAHFCKSSFGDSPRALRNRMKNGDSIPLLTQERLPSEDERY